MEILLLALLAGFMLWLIAVVDLVKATDMDMGGRMILAGALLLIPPVGVLLWLLARQGKLGLVVAVTLIVVTMVIVAGVLTSATFQFGRVSSVQVQHSMQGLAAPSQP